MPTLMDGRLLTVEDVAERLQVSTETVRRWLRTGKLRGVRLGAARAGWRIAAGDVERILNTDRG